MEGRAGYVVTWSRAVTEGIPVPSPPRIPAFAGKSRCSVGRLAVGSCLRRPYPSVPNPTDAHIPTPLRGVGVRPSVAPPAPHRGYRLTPVRRRKGCGYRIESGKSNQRATQPSPSPRPPNANPRALIVIPSPSIARAKPRELNPPSHNHCHHSRPRPANPPRIPAPRPNLSPRIPIDGPLSYHPQRPTCDPDTPPQACHPGHPCFHSQRLHCHSGHPCFHSQRLCRQPVHPCFHSRRLHCHPGHPFFTTNAFFSIRARFFCHCYENRPDNPNPVVPGKPVPMVGRRGGHARHRRLPTGRQHPIFITLCGLEKAIVIPSAAEESETFVHRTAPELLRLHPDKRDQEAVRGRHQRPRECANTKRSSCQGLRASTTSTGSSTTRRHRMCGPR